MTHSERRATPLADRFAATGAAGAMTSRPPLNRARTTVLAVLAVVWFGEMVLWGIRPLAELWARLWGLLAMDPREATALYLAHTIEAAAKGALGVLAVFALRSRTPFTRSALLAAMALVPPLNVAFPFRAQGWPLRPTLIGATISVVLWETFVLFRDPAERPRRPARLAPRSGATLAGAVRRGWFAANAIVLTLAGACFLFAPSAGLRLTLPCVVGPPASVPSAQTLAGMAVGTHLTALAVATWIGTIWWRRHTAVRRAVASANAVHAALLCALPGVQLARSAGITCASSSLLVYAIPLLAGWLAYAALSPRAAPSAPSPIATPAGP